MPTNVDIIHLDSFGLSLFSKQAPTGMNSLFWRTTAIVLHAVANFILISMLFRYDITGSWLFFFSFIILVLLLLYFFIRHLVSYIYFIKKIKI